MHSNLNVENEFQSLFSRFEIVRYLQGYVVSQTNGKCDVKNLTFMIRFVSNNCDEVSRLGTQYIIMIVSTEL